jgi:lysozyme
MMPELVAQLRRDEGVRYAAYKDTLGNWTTGVGHLIRIPGEEWLLTAILSDDQVNSMLDQDIIDKQRQLVRFPWFMALDDCRQGAICNMTFNLGVAGLLKFPSMIHYLSIGDWANASVECDDPHWESQVGDRVDRIAKQLLTGEWQ